MSATRAQIRNTIARSARLTASIAKTPVLRAQFSHELARDEGTYNLLFPRGTWHGANLAPIGGSIDLDSGILEEMVANWEAAGRPKLPIRKTHRHLDDDVSAVERLELEKSYGWLTDLRATERGLEARTEWTEAGAAAVKAGEFSFWSPEWQPKHRDRRTGEVKGWWLSGTALTNDPFFNEMPPVAASHGGGQQEAAKWLRAAIARHERHMSGAEPTSEDSQMQMMDEMKRALGALEEMPPVAASADDAETTDHPQHRSTTMNEEQLKQLRASLGLAVDASIDTILKAAAEQGVKLTASVSGEKLTAAIKDAVAPLEAKLQASEAKAKDLADALRDQQVEKLIADARRNDGKTGRAINDTLVATAKKLAVESLDAAKTFLEAIPASVPLAPVGVQGTNDGPLTASAAQQKLNTLAAELRAKGSKTPFEDAIAQIPEVARVAEGLAPTTRS
ncbi:MAG TPA: phage protease [Archangium sp.]